MIRSCWLVPVAACAFATAAVAQPLRTASPSSVSPVRIQYDQVREFLDAGAPLPGPDDFEQAYASAKSTIPPPPPSRADAMAIVESEMKAIKAMQVKQRFADMARGQAISLLNGAIRGISNPLVSMIAGRALSGAEARMEDQVRQREEQALQQREDQLANAAGQKMAMQALHAVPALQRISIWGKWVRIDNPVEHTAVVYRPDKGQYLVIDNAHKLYRIIDGPAPAPAPPPIICNQKGTVTALGAGNLDGVPVHGYRATTILSDDDLSMTDAQTFYAWDKPLPQRVLEIATGNPTCSPDSPVGRRYPQGRLMLYMATAPKQASAGNDGSDASMAGSIGIETVQWRGHLRMLTDIDRALFEPPPGYRQVQ